MICARVRPEVYFRRIAVSSVDRIRNWAEQDGTTVKFIRFYFCKLIVNA